MIEFAHDGFDLCCGHRTEAGFPRKVSPYQAVAIFLEPPFLGGLRRGEVKGGLQLPGHGVMLGKCLAVVRGEGRYPLSDGA